MKKINILYIGRHPEILATVVRLLNKNETWNGVGVQTDEAAIEAFKETDFDLVLLGPGIEAESEKQLRSVFNEQKSNIIIIQHYGGGSGLLTGEIMQALYEGKQLGGN